MFTKTDELTRFIATKYAKGATRENVESLINDIEILINQINPSSNGNGDSCSRLLNNEIYLFTVRTERWTNENSYGYNVVIRAMLSTSTVILNSEEEDGRSAFEVRIKAPESVCKVHRQKLEKGELRLSNIIEIEGFDDRKINDMIDTGSEIIYWTEAKAEYTWNKVASGMRTIARLPKPNKN